jgi:lycopene beta-cyclase
VRSDHHQNYDRKKSDAPASVEILGGGLAGSLALCALKWKWPDLEIRVWERAEFKKAHTWCFHESDIDPDSWVWLKPLVSHSWEKYSVRFPRRSRTLQSRYHAIRSEDFHAKVRGRYPGSFFKLEAGANILGDRSQNNLVLRATGWPVSERLEDPRQFGWQKFVGLDLRLSKPHGLNGPILKDATVEQTDGYRFVYSLPWDERTLLVEDTYYSNSQDLDIENVKERILGYVKSQGWEVESVLREEAGALPLEMSSNFKNDPENEVSIGAASGLAHPVTGYTTSSLFYQIEAGLKSDRFSPELFRENVLRAKREQAQQFRYFHLLNRMLFFAAEPKERYRVLERFYGLDAELIGRFYAGRLRLTDRARILVGRPPVPLGPALREWRHWQFNNI